MKDIPLMYHGTDARILRMPQDERHAMKKKCLLAIDYMWQFYKPLYTEWETVPINKPGMEGCTTVRQKIKRYDDILNDRLGQYGAFNLHNALTCNNARVEVGNEQYQYDDLYLTNDIEKAKSYAISSFAFGEIGLIAYRMLVAADIISFSEWNPSDEIKSAINDVKHFAEGKAEPAVIPLDNLKRCHMKTDTGEPIEWEHKYFHIFLNMVRYTDSICLNPDNAILL